MVFIYNFIGKKKRETMRTVHHRALQLGGQQIKEVSLKGPPTSPNTPAAAAAAGAGPAPRLRQPASNP